MNITVTDHYGYSIMVLEGSFTMVTAPSVKAKIESVVADGVSRIVVDLAQVDYIDSSGLGALIGGLKAARQAGGDLRIAAPATQITAVLKLTNLDRILVPHPSVEDAASAW